MAESTADEAPNSSTMRSARVVDDDDDEMLLLLLLLLSGDELA
jgi:hypothetical protein